MQNKLAFENQQSGEQNRQIAQSLFQDPSLANLLQLQVNPVDVQAQIQASQLQQITNRQIIEDMRAPNLFGIG